MHIINNIFWFSIFLAFLLETVCLPLSNKVDNLNSGNQTIQTTAATTDETTAIKKKDVILIVLKTLLSLLVAAVSKIIVWMIAAFCIYKGTYQITKRLKAKGAESFNIKEKNSCNCCNLCCFTRKVCCSSCVCFWYRCCGGRNEKTRATKPSNDSVEVIPLISLSPEQNINTGGDQKSQDDEVRKLQPYVNMDHPDYVNMDKLNKYDLAYKNLYRDCTKINFHEFLKTYKQYLQKGNMSHGFHCKRDECKKLKHKHYELQRGLRLEPVIYFLVFDWNKLLSKSIQAEEKLSEKDLFFCLFKDNNENIKDKEWKDIKNKRMKNVFVTLLNFPHPSEFKVSELKSENIKLRHRENIKLRDLVLNFFNTLEIANANIVLKSDPQNRARVIKYHNAGSGNHHFTVSKNDLKTFPNEIDIISKEEIKERSKIDPKTSHKTITNVEDTNKEFVIKIQFDPKESHQKKFWFRISVNDKCKLEKPYLQSQMFTNTSSTPLTWALDMICQRIHDLKRFANVLGVGNLVSDRLLEDERYNKDEKMKKCIDEKKETSEGDLDWFYWRSKLLQLDEEDLIEDIEERFPCLLQDKRIDITHIAVKHFGILAHGASKTLFDKLPINMKGNIEVSIGAGGVKILEVSEMPTIQDIYFENFEIFTLEKIQLYDFSQIRTNKECKVLQTVYKWLQNNEDTGFCIKGYDAKQHLDFLNKDYCDDRPYNDSYILVYSKNYNVILSIDTNTDDIIKSIRHNRSNVRFLCSSNQCLDEISFVYVPITLFDPNKHKIDDQCKTCTGMELLVSLDKFKDLELFSKWWENISTDVNKIKCELDEKSDISNNIFKSIMTFMAFDDRSELPSFTTNSENQIEEAKKLIMLTHEQRDIAYSTSKHKIIKGPYGSGKTIVAQKILKLVASNSTDSDIAYYILHDSDSDFDNEMKKIVEKIVEKIVNSNVKCCKRSDLVKGDNSLSSLLKYLLEINKEKTIHVFIEEFNGEVLNKREIEKIQVLLEKFKNSHIVLVAQSMESERQTNNGLSAMLYETYQYDKLIQDTDFKMFHLSYLLRSSLHINDIVNAAIPILEKAKINTSIPKPAQQTNPKVVSTNTSATTSSIKRNLDIKRSPSSGITTEISKQPSITRKDDTMFDDSMTDTDKFLKQCSIMNADSKKQIESSYTFVGSGKNGHNIKGMKPVIYYPFCKEGKKFSYQMYCISEVMKVILKNKKKEHVIICLNMESINMLKCALKVNRIEWTNDRQLMSTTVCLLTDYTAVRGCEFLNVVLIYPNDERYLKHHLVDCINRCKLNLYIVVIDVVVFKKGIPDDTLVAILNEWIDTKLVKAADLDYLIEDADLKKFEEVHNDTLTKLKQEEITKMDVNDPKVIEKLKRFESVQNDTKHDEIGTNQKLEDISQASNNDEEVPAEAVESYAVFQDIWKTCKEASRNNNRSLLVEALHRNNLDVNAIYYTLDVKPYFEHSLLYYAAIENDVDVVKLLCSIDNIDVNTTDVYGNTPLMYAAMYNNIDVVRVLLNMNNIDVNITNEVGNTALKLATFEGYNEIVDLLKYR